MGHQRFHFSVAQDQGAFHNVLLHSLHLASIGAFLNDAFDFFFRDVGVVAVETENLDEDFRIV